MRNLQLEVRELLQSAAALQSVEVLYSDTRLDGVLDDDSGVWFWRQVEQRFDVMVSKSNKEKLLTVGDVIAFLQHGLKLRSA